MWNLSSIRTKSSLPVIVITLTLFINIGSYAYMTYEQKDALDAQSNYYLKAISAILNADRDLYQAHVAELNLLAGRGDLQAEEQDRQDNAQQVKDRFASYLGLLQQAGHTGTSSQFDQAFNTWKGLSDKLAEQAKAGQPVPAADLAQVKTAFGALRDILDAAGERGENLALEAKETLQANIVSLKVASWVFIVVAFLFSAWLGYQIPKTLTSQINYVNRRIDEIASGDGDLTARIEVRGKDEFATLATNFNHLLDNLQQLIKGVVTRTHGLNDETKQLTQSAIQGREVIAQLSGASDSIASAVHQMSMSSKEMTAVAESSSQEAHDAQSMAQQGLGVVERSSNQVDALSEDMDFALTRSTELQKSSDNIASVLEVIRSIAEQTNLLALNAAIEAARAGEQGRGFAVVADEVRTLATRTQESTNDIQKMVEEFAASVEQSLHAIERGKTNADQVVAIIAEASQVFNDLYASSQKVNEMSNQTAHATKEQTNVAEEVSGNLSHLSEQTAESEALSQQTENAAKTMQALVDELHHLIVRFKV